MGMKELIDGKEDEVEALLGDDGDEVEEVIEAKEVR